MNSSPVTAPSAAAPDTAETAESLLATLRQLYAEGRVGMQLDGKRLMHMDSPVHYEAEGNQWVYGLLAVTALIWWKLGWQVGAAVATASIILYMTVAKSIMRKRIDRRVREQIFNDVVRWRKLWNFGGVVLTRTDATGDGVSCEAPRGNWMEFVRRFSRDS